MKLIACIIADPDLCITKWGKASNSAALRWWHRDQVVALHVHRRTVRAAGSHPTLGESIGMAAQVAHGSWTDLPPARK